MVIAVRNGIVLNIQESINRVFLIIDFILFWEGDKFLKKRQKTIGQLSALGQIELFPEFRD